MLHEHSATLSQALKNKIAADLADFSQQHQNMRVACSDLMERLKLDVQEHQVFNDRCQACVEQLATMKDRMTTSVDVGKDKFAVQARLDVIQVSVLQFCSLCFYISLF